jgi:glycosyltransferase involved in cell wall biosynthesis
MKVLFIRPNLGPGGAERHLSILLPGLRGRGFDARFIALKDGGPFEQPLRDAGVPLEILGMRSQADFGPIVRSRLIRRFSPDAIVSSDLSGLYVGTAIARYRRALNCYNDHRCGVMPLSGRREAMVRLIMKRHLDLVIAISARQTDTWRRRGYPADRIEVIRNGVLSQRMSESRKQVRAALGIDESAVIALLAARLRPEKRVSDFVSAVVRAHERVPELIGVVAGEGEDRPAVESAAADRDAVRLLGHRDDLPNLLGAADIFVLASEHEALPMAILEAMAAGLPVIATRVGDIPEAVEDEVTGVLVAPRDPDGMALALQRLAVDVSLRQAMGAAALQLHRAWTAESMIAGYAAALERVAGRFTPLE